MNGDPVRNLAEQPRHSAVDSMMLTRVYLVMLPFTLYFFFSGSAQVRWPVVAEIAFALDAVIGGFGVIAFFSWWPICLAFGDSPFADRLCRVGLKSIMWSIYLMPLSLLFGGLKQLTDSPILF